MSDPLTRARESLSADWRPFRELPEGFEWYEQLVFGGEAERRCEPVYKSKLPNARPCGARYHFRLVRR